MLHCSCIVMLAVCKMADKIKHLGIVENINGSCLKVRIVQTSALRIMRRREGIAARPMRKRIDTDVISGKRMECHYEANGVAS